MAKRRNLHPIRRIREELKRSPEDLGLKEYASADGFARLVGRSASLIRNVESGFTPQWEALAELIQRKTKVSKEWLLSDPPDDGPIQDIKGDPWDPKRHMDTLAARDKMPNWREILRLQPAIVPRLIADLIHGQLVWDLSFGFDHGLKQIVSSLSRAGAFYNPGLQELIAIQSTTIKNEIAKRLWSQQSGAPIRRSELEKRYKLDLDAISIEEAEQILADHGMGWINHLDEIPNQGQLAELKRFYKKRV